MHYTSSHIPEVEPAALLDRLEIVRIFDYGLNGIVAPEATKPRLRTAPLMASADEQRPGIRPRATLARRLDHGGASRLSRKLTILLMLLTEVPLGWWTRRRCCRRVALASVWFWSLYRPGRDVAAGGVRDRAIARFAGLAAGRHRRVDAADRARAGAALAALPSAARLRDGVGGFRGRRGGAAALEWLATAVLTWRLVPPGAMLFQAVLSAALYPALAILFARAHRSIANPEQA